MPGPIDIHTHWCLFGRDPSKVLAELCWLESQGLEKVVFFPLPGMGASPKKVWEMIPGAYRDLIGLTVERAANDDLDAWLSFQETWRGGTRKLELLSFLDVRAWDGLKNLSPWWGDGHAGLKAILIEEEDEAKMKMMPLRHVTGITRSAYFDAQRKVFDTAARLDVPLVYHVDLTSHRSFIEECLQEHPQTRVNIPHFGFSRKQMAEMLDTYPSLKTDVSSLGTFIEKNPSSYRDFCVDYPDRVMLGSDVIASFDMRLAVDYIGHVKAMDLPSNIEARVLSENANCFLNRE